MENIDVLNAIRYMWQNEGLKIPYDNIHIVLVIDGEEVEIRTKNQWDSYQWNPPGAFAQYVEPDPNASPKPTWDEVKIANRKEGLRVKTLQANYDIPDLSQHRTALTDAATIDHEGESLYVGGRSRPYDRIAPDGRTGQ